MRTPGRTPPLPVLQTLITARTENAALRLIARAEQCVNGLRRKLEKRGCDRDSIDAVIEKLCSLGLLDDDRFCRLWIESRLHLVRSPRRLLISLCTRGIARGDGEAALANALDEETEYTLLQRFAGKYAKKFKSRGEDRSFKYFLKNEGFSSTAIQRYLEEN